MSNNPHQVNVGTEFSNTSNLTLETAILLYSGGKHSMVTMHDVDTEQNGRPFLKPGKVINGKELRARLDIGQWDSVAPYIPENVLQMGPGVMAWYKPSHVNHILFKIREKSRDAKFLNKVSGVKVRYPSLLFMAKENSLYVWALKFNTRPKPETKLYTAPFYNIWDSGKICLGTSVGNLKFQTDHIEDWEDLFFNSMFSHSNQSQIVKGGHNKFWKGYCQQCKKGIPKRFPADALLPAEKKVKDVIR